MDSDSARLLDSFNDPINEAGKAVQAGFDAFVNTADNIVTNVGAGFGAVIGGALQIEKQVGFCNQIEKQVGLCNQIEEQVGLCNQIEKQVGLCNQIEKQVGLCDDLCDDLCPASRDVLGSALRVAPRGGGVGSGRVAGGRSRLGACRQRRVACAYG